MGHQVNYKTEKKHKKDLLNKINYGIVYELIYLSALIFLIFTLDMLFYTLNCKKHLTIIYTLSRN